MFPTRPTSQKGWPTRKKRLECLLSSLNFCNTVLILTLQNSYLVEVLEFVKLGNVFNVKSFLFSTFICLSCATSFVNFWLYHVSIEQHNLLLIAYKNRTTLLPGKNNNSQTWVQRPLSEFRFCGRCLQVVLVQRYLM